MIKKIKIGVIWVYGIPMYPHTPKPDKAAVPQKHMTVNVRNQKKRTRRSRRSCHEAQRIHTEDITKGSRESKIDARTNRIKDLSQTDGCIHKHCAIPCIHVDVRGESVCLSLNVFVCMCAGGG
jgi:hypothetical protein